MQFIAQLPLDELEVFSRARRQILSIFMCQADPGMCDDFAPDSGGNASLLFDSASLVPLPTPDDAPTLSKTSLLRFEETNHASDQDAYSRQLASVGSVVLGKAGGQPFWIQGEETPTCQCGRTMTFVAQLEDRGGGGINFGDVGTGYAFACDTCPDQARFLWQCG